jgi:hypothetical protein
MIQVLDYGLGLVDVNDPPRWYRNIKHADLPALLMQLGADRPPTPEEQQLLLILEDQQRTFLDPHCEILFRRVHELIAIASARQWIKTHAIEGTVHSLRMSWGDETHRYLPDSIFAQLLLEAGNGGSLSSLPKRNSSVLS